MGVLDKLPGGRVPIPHSKFAEESLNSLSQVVGGFLREGDWHGREYAVLPVHGLDHWTELPCADLVVEEIATAVLFVVLYPSEVQQLLDLHIGGGLPHVDEPLDQETRHVGGGWHTETNQDFCVDKVLSKM